VLPREVLQLPSAEPRQPQRDRRAAGPFGLADAVDKPAPPPNLVQLVDGDDQVMAHATILSCRSSSQPDPATPPCRLTTPHQARRCGEVRPLLAGAATCKPGPRRPGRRERAPQPPGESIAIVATIARCDGSMRPRSPARARTARSTRQSRDSSPSHRAPLPPAARHLRPPGSPANPVERPSRQNAPDQRAARTERHIGSARQ